MTAFEVGQTWKDSKGPETFRILKIEKGPSSSLVTLVTNEGYEFSVGLPILKEDVDAGRLVLVSQKEAVSDVSSACVHEWRDARDKKFTNWCCKCGELK